MSAQTPGTVVDPTVTRRFVGHFLDPDPRSAKTGHRVTVELAWWVRDPFAVAVTVYARPRPATWVVARELLAAGLQGPAGLGEVSILPDVRDERRVELVVSFPDGRCGFRLPRSAIAEFLRSLWTVDTTSWLGEWLQGVVRP